MATYSGIQEYERNDKNPFIDDLSKKIEIKKRKEFLNQHTEGKNKKAVQFVIDQDGEQVAISTFVQYKEVDPETFTKIYNAELQAFWNLSKSAIKLFTFITHVLEPRKDTFIFRIHEAMEFMGYTSKAPIYQGLSGLLGANFIARTLYENEYYINPLIFFNGDRAAFVKVYRNKNNNTKFTNPYLNAYDNTHSEQRNTKTNEDHHEH
ncbi:MAG: hypothetical protein DA328_04450 [Nitrososphaeraceae archaeon]|nr:hypothetical protein [Nitrososphaeraceae archaeon]